MSDSKEKLNNSQDTEKKSKWFPFGGNKPTADAKPEGEKRIFDNSVTEDGQQTSVGKGSLEHSEPNDSFSQNQANAEQQPAEIEDGLAPSRQGLWSKLGNVFKGTFDLNDELFDELEETLMTCDIGVQASLTLVDRLRERITKEKIQNKEGVLNGLRKEVSELLEVAETPWQFTHQLQVILVVGVNGVGKTTTTAKMANHLKSKGHNVMLAAADTFRAAAVAQLQEWGHRLDIPVISQGQGADAAAVAHDALIAAQARGCDILIIDTAGRLHTQSELMEQLGKVVRVLKKIDPTAPHDVIQVLDAGTGQNALSQLDHFRDAVDVNGLCLTKLDGSAKGGVALSLTEKHKLAIRFVGVGEGINDLREFSATQFAHALIATD